LDTLKQIHLNIQNTVKISDSVFKYKAAESQQRARLLGTVTWKKRPKGEILRSQDEGNATYLQTVKTRA